MYQYGWTGNFQEVTYTTFLAQTTLLQFLGSTGCYLLNKCRQCF